MKIKVIAIAVMALCAVTASMAAVTPWTQVVWNDGTSDVASTKTALQTAEYDSVLVSFTAGGTEYTSFILSDSNNLPVEAVYDYGQSATDPGSANAALADDRIDSLTMNNHSGGDGTEFYFSAAPADINGVLFLCDFREFSSQRVEFQLLDSSGAPIGSTVTTTATHWEIGGVAMLQTVAELSNFRGVAIPLTDFGISDASVIGGVRFNEGGGVDPCIIGITGPTVPEGTPTADAGIDQTILDADDNGAETVTLDGTGSFDSDGTLVSYQWLEGGSEIATGATAPVSLSIGAHSITLIVTDDAALTSSDIVVITIQTSDPVADAGADQSVMIGDLVTLDGSASYDPAGTIVGYEWDEGGSPLGSGVTIDVTLAPGVHTITLTVTDDGGLTGSDTVDITVDPGAPDARAGLNQIVGAGAGGTALVTLDGSASTDPAGSIVSYDWSEDESSIATGVTVDVALTPGVHTITLTVTDDDGYTDTDDVEITVAAYVAPMTYYLDAGATGPAYDGSQADPWQTVEQMQQALADKANNGSGDTVLIAPGTYDDFLDGALYGSDATDLQFMQLPRTHWLTLKGQDPDNKPVFGRIEVHGPRDAYLAFEDLHMISVAPHAYYELVYVRKGVNHLRFTNLDMEATDDESQLPRAFYITAESPSDILVEGCDIHNLERAFNVAGDNITIRNNEIHHMAASAIVTNEGQNYLIENNYIHDQIHRIVRLFVYGPVTGNFTKGDTVTQETTGATGEVYKVFADKLEITPPNKVTIQFETGYAVNNDSDTGVVGPLTVVGVSDWSHGSGLAIFGNSSYTARGNVIHDYGHSGGIFLYPDGNPFTDMLFENNVLYDIISTHAMFQDLGDNIVMRNNTFVGMALVRFHATSDGSGLTFENNIVQVLSTEYADDLANFNENNNVITHLLTTEPMWDNYAQFTPPSTSIVYTYVPGNAIAMFAPFWALFNDPDNKDFTLAAGSDAIGQADPATATAFDVLGLPRDAQPDAGAYEYGAGVCSPGDADGDGDVDLDDFVILKTNFGTTSGATCSEGDFDGDGDVDLDDFVLLKSNFGT